MTSMRPAITGPGLRKQGVVVLQIFFISLFTFAELVLRSGTGILTGLVIAVVTFGGIRFGRPGTRYVSVVHHRSFLPCYLLLIFLLPMAFQSHALASIFWLPLPPLAPGFSDRPYTDGLCF